MDKLDFKRADKVFYTGKFGRFDRLTLPELPYLMIDGAGDPNTAPAYVASVSALYALSYGAKFRAKATLGRDHVIGPLEGLWWAKDMADFAAGRREGWQWTMMIRQPPWITAPHLAETKAALMAKLAKDPAPPTTAAIVNAVRLEHWAEGDCLQTLHIGPYADEAPTIAHLHDTVIPDAGLRPTGHHHEIYLNDPRRVAPAALKTILRQPVGPASPLPNTA